MLKKLIADYVYRMLNEQFNKAFADMKERATVITEYDEPVEYSITRPTNLETQIKLRFKNKPPRYFVVKVSEPL